MAEIVETILRMAEEDERARVAQNECIFVFPTDMAGIRVIDATVKSPKSRLPDDDLSRRKIPQLQRSIS